MLPSCKPLLAVYPQWMNDLVFHY
ncbi:MAG: hypothetical protein PWQ54_2074, partial [Bacteroidales bacterium]|nr:hypothetical protein [Bacteroidales bacterium]